MRDDDGRPASVALYAGTPPAVDRRDLDADVFGLRDLVPRGGRAVVVARHAPVVLAALVALDGWADRVDLRSTPDAEPPTGAVVLDDAVAHRRHCAASTGEDAPVPTRWRLWSSGTTGSPSATDHELAALLGPARRASTPRRRWGLLFRPTRMAGVQVLAQVLVAGDQVVDATHLGDLGAQLAFLEEHQVDALSATPTLWRRILQHPRSAGLRLRQATLGGETADQRLIDELTGRYHARVTHVYASTEAGTTLSVSDGREGFPRRLLGTRDTGSPLRVRGDVLYVYAPGSSAAGSDGYVCTDDLVEVRGDRVLFRGRASGLVNVGGDQVSPERLETVLREHPDVLDARVTARRSSFVGHVLVARVTVDDQVAGDRVGVLPTELRGWVTGRLPRSYVPARVEIVDELPVSVAGKAVR